MTILQKGKGKRQQTWVCKLEPGDHTAETIEEPVIDIRRWFFSNDKNEWFPLKKKGFRISENYIRTFMKGFATFVEHKPTERGSFNFSSFLLPGIKFLMLNSSMDEPSKEIKEIRVCVVPIEENITVGCNEGEWTDYWKGKPTKKWSRREGMTISSELAHELNEMLQSLSKDGLFN